ncbi:MAG TPA: RagB/SusD family nutrient uptake outer membrane protein [Parapedobacter sp.]|uniref:RagB/SusD family nutrient uptake outer membrane protein n=1 Tax=Parapedobacter sp. TaxID=1958893 RepID=UPI002BD3BFC2|nr:RagB/SusD family nutrient uptake outer membrane protein [Parapedobacter sp.]HWK58893.1 RagB/SusD family nutrient uptake outer membrane protein [Parapedobacter sp.]
MIKNILGIALMAWVILSTVSCSGFLEEELVSARTTDNHYVDEQGYEDLVKSAYSPLREIHKLRGLTLLGTDIFTRPGDPALGGLNQFNEYSPQAINPQDGNSAVYWTFLYAAIARTNTAIDRAPGASMNEATKTMRISEIKFLRALYYFYLVQQFGDVPLPLNEITEVVTTTERIPEAKVYEQIIKDLEEAIPVLPPSQEEYGRVTKGAAQHLLAKVYLTRGYRDFAGSNDFAKAASLATEVIGSGEYQLLDTFGEVFQQGNEENNEILFAVQYSANTVLNGDGNDAHSLFGQGVDGLIGMDRSSTYNRQQATYVPTRYLSSLYDTDMDTRYDVTFLRIFYATVDKGDVKVGDTVLYFPKWDQPWTAEQMAAADYLVVNYDEYYMNVAKQNQFPPLWKFFEAGLPYGDDKGTRDLFVFRLAETHLIAAEAYLQAGDEPTALGHINAVRRRAGNPGMKDAMELSSVTLDDILDERARELCGEEPRWTELKRTGKLIERVKLYNERASEANTIQDFHLLRPIPLSEIERSSNTVSQNLGY